MSAALLGALWLLLTPEPGTWGRHSCLPNAWQTGMSAPRLQAAEKDQPRSHPRLPKERPDGRREKLSLGTLFLPKALPLKGAVPLLIHFHGGDWLAEVAAARQGMAVLTVQLGSGSAVYGKPFADPKRFGELLREIETKANLRVGAVTLSGWSAGYGAVRAILKTPDGFARVQGVVLLDGMHAGYADKDKKQVVAEHVEVFVKFAKEAAAGKKRMLISHSEIVPGAYASTTETADYLLAQLELPRQASRHVGPVRMQQRSEARRGRLLVLGFVGDAAPDHVDHLYALPDYLKTLAQLP